MSHPFNNGDEQVEGNILNVGGYVGVDPRFQNRVDVLKQDEPFPDGVKESNGEVKGEKPEAAEDPEDDDDKSDDDKPKAPAKAAAPKAPSVPAPGNK